MPSTGMALTYITVTFNKTPQNVGLICLEIKTVEDTTENNSHASIHQTKKMNQKYSYTINYNLLWNKTLHGFQEGHFPSYHCLFYYLDFFWFGPSQGPLSSLNF